MKTSSPCLAALLLAIAVPQPAGAQLRPLDPTEWSTFAHGDALAASIGVGAFADQHASLTGNRGTLLELGNFSIGWKTGRVLLEASGTVVRRFTEGEQVRAPFESVLPARDGVRQDAGDMRVAATVRLSASDWPALLGLRFGTRLPTTDNRLGLDRDMTDFFALLIGRVQRGAIAASAEVGVSINGTRFPTYEQEDVLAYVLGVEYAARGVALHAELAGQNDLHDFEVRGNENLNEVRVGARVGGRRWIRVQFVYGTTEYSPGPGVLVTAGVRRPH